MYSAVNCHTLTHSIKPKIIMSKLCSPKKTFHKKNLYIDFHTANALKDTQKFFIVFTVNFVFSFCSFDILTVLVFLVETFKKHPKIVQHVIPSLWLTLVSFITSYSSQMEMLRRLRLLLHYTRIVKRFKWTHGHY